MDFKNYIQKRLLEGELSREQSEFLDSLVASIMEKYQNLNMDQAIDLLKKYIQSLGY